MDASSSSPRGRSLAVVLVLIAAALLGIVLATPRAAAAGNTTYLAGSACTGSSTPTWLTGDTWVLYGDVSVNSGCVLTVEHGAMVKADPSVHLYVDGSLHVDGSSGDPVVFVNNQTTVTSWAGIQFNPGSGGWVTWSSFDRVQIAVAAHSSSPAINNNTVLLAGAGVYLDGSSSLVADNVIDGQRIGPYGIVFTSSDAALARNRINGTTFGIQGSGGGTVTAYGNTITNTSGSIAIGIYLDNLATATLSDNTIQTVIGRDAGPGSRGGTGAAILVNGTAEVILTGNSVSLVRGGRGGDGASGTIGKGSPGGDGGAAAGIALGAVTTAILQTNTVTGIAGNRGGSGGSSSGSAGGTAGAGGIAFALELFSSTGDVSFVGNRVGNVSGGDGGVGGVGTLTSNGMGGFGADAYGIFSPGGMNANISSNTVDGLQGGAGGNSPLLGNVLPGMAGSGGNATAVIAVARGSPKIFGNVIANLTAGVGGDAHSFGGAGGNATGILVLDTATAFNGTEANYNRVTALAGGDGGVGGKRSGDGGNATGIGGMHVDLSMFSNTVSTLSGGNGGIYAIIGNQASSGGSASGVIFLEVPEGSSSLDSVENIAAGLSGGGASPPVSYGVGYYFAGNATVETRVTLANGTIAGTASFDLYVDNHTVVTTLNTPFSGSKLAVMATGTLTVQNFLNVRALWPNNLNEVWGAQIVVKDNGAEIYNRTRLFSGSANWIVATNRIYMGGPVAVWNTTEVSVNYQAYAFADDPRIVNVTASQTQTFTMVDTDAPISSAVALPTWTTTRTFPVFVTCSDFLGVGVSNVTLWYRLDGGSWVAFGNTSFFILGIGGFSFIAPSDGTYEFATTAIDDAGNEQQPTPPSGNNTWTIVDTLAPTSHVLALPQYETSATFTVSWAANGGVTDVANYTIQVNMGSGWVDWLTNTTATSASYTSTTQGPIAFRSVARDLAGNRESKAENDTWTVVDTVSPQVLSRSPTGNLTVSPTVVVITFSEPMDQGSVEAAISVSPLANGTFSWSNGSRTLTITFTKPLAEGTTYTVTMGTGARDLAGNQMVLPSVFVFATPAPPPSPGLSLLDLWPLWVLIAVVLAAVAFFLVRRRGTGSAQVAAEAPKPPPAAAPAKPEAAIDDVFLLYRRDGILIKHETRRLRPDIDSDILSGMLNAVQQFVKDSLLGTEGDELNEMVLGQMHILIGRGKWLVLAATITGGDMASMSTQIQNCIQDMEDHNWDRLEDWDGDMVLSKSLGPYLKKLIRGEYAA